MKLLNRTKIADGPLKALVTAAGKAVGARTGKVVAQVNPGQGSTGHAYKCDWVRWAGSTKRKARFRNTDCGAFRVTLAVGNRQDALNLAQAFYNLCAHEWGHVLDYQRDRQGAQLEWDRPGRGKRRGTWGNRPEEIRACAYEQEAQENANEYADEIVDLAIAIEAAYPSRKTI